MWVISKKALRFTRPGAKVIESLMNTYERGGSIQTNSISNDCCEVKPHPPGEGGKHVGAYGPPTQIPDWAESDPYFQLCVNDGILLKIPNPNPQKVSAPAAPSEVATTLATLQGAAAQESEALGGSSFDIANLPIAPVAPVTVTTRRKKAS